MRPFEPVGDRARWRVVYELLRLVLVDMVITYDELAEALELDADKDRRKIQQAMSRAARELLKVDKHAVEVVPNEGYRVVKPNEHLGLAQRKGKRAERALARGHETVTNVDFNELEASTRHTFELVGRAMSWQIGMMKRLDSRQRDFEQSLSSVQATVSKTSADQAAHEERLRWLEEQEQKRQQAS